MNRSLRIYTTSASALALTVLLACGGGGGGGGSQPPAPVYANSLDYTNPTGGTYRLVKNAAYSSSTHLVLDLVAPDATSLAGVAFYLNADSTRVTWSKVAGGDAKLVQNAAFVSVPSVVEAKASGNELQAGAFHRGGTPITTSGGTVLVRVALDLKGGLNLPVNTTVSLSAPSGKAKALQGISASGAYAPVEIAVGTVTAK